MSGRTGSCNRSDKLVTKQCAATWSGSSMRASAEVGAEAAEQLKGMRSSIARANSW